MKRTRAALAAATLTTVVTVTMLAALPTSPAAADDTPTCQGKPATIVGPGPDNRIVGTPGDDVIVTPADGNGSISTYDGDDLVCLIPGTGIIPDPETVVGFPIYTGPGNDTVINSEPRPTASQTVVLGEGDDTYIGNDRNETVYAGDLYVSEVPGTLTADEGTDTIATGGGEDNITTGSLNPTVVNHDTINSGPGADSIRYSGTGATLDNGPVDATGTGGDYLTLLRRSPLGVVINVDNRTQSATDGNGVFVHWNNAAAFHILADGPVRFTGADRDEHLFVTSLTPAESGRAIPVEVAMNGGDDTFMPYSGMMPGTFDGGTGTDTLRSIQKCGTVVAELNLHYTCTVGPKKRSTTYILELDSVEQAEPIWARTSVNVKGTRQADTIVAWAPRITIRGRGGDDRISVAKLRTFKPRTHLIGGAGNDRIVGGIGKDTLVGGVGHDTMRGSAGRDRLTGGRGHDIAKGGTGTDWCDAETRRGCELPRRHR